MGFHLYITRLKSILRNRENLFWCYMFPIILATCYHFAFANMMSASSFVTIPIAYVSEDTEHEDSFLAAMTEAEMSNGIRMFEVTECDKETAAGLLEDKKIEAYIIGSIDPVLHIRENGTNETIMKAFLDSYRQMQATVNSILAANPDALGEGLLQDIGDYDSYVNEIENGKKPDAVLIYYYALFALTCMFAANWGVDEVTNIQADQSTQGARVNISPVRKMKLLMSNMLAALTAHIGSIALLFIYMYYVIKIDFGDKLSYIILLCAVGSIAGLALGSVIGVYIRKSNATKNAIITSVVMTGSFLSGMMYRDMKFIIAENVPILGYINPVNLITDALYSLYYYDTYERFFLNISILCALSAVLGIASFLGLRRKAYASI